ncbi:hypothetical protein TanjilG_13398 [Lupinus angustifolius]|uniref:Tetraspanin-8-like n=1 Tax=Lupinus angustifolius TaxID=3871 RepID=A0A4P1RUC3_LUPAN|nr:PREDICTED: tetraspanin-8-like [Lupinus angustifolius]OIW18646.1 hypothetical protein TanjilG_13398 [Lupinus angustifolius]
MVRCSNSLIGTLNFLTFLLSIPVLFTGIWLSKQAHTECDRWLERPIIAFGVFLLLISLAGLIGACCHVRWLLWLYLVVMFMFILLLSAFSIFVFVVTIKGDGEELSGKGYKEYRLGNYSIMLQNRVNNPVAWNRMKSCLQSSQICFQFQKQYVKDNVHQFYNEKLSALQSGCCKPSNDCGFTYQSPTRWMKTGNVTHSNPDCDAWSNDPNIMCFNCQSCKAALLQNTKTDWRNVSIVNAIILIFLSIVYSIGCCAFRNIKKDNWKGY